jgi:hypothetical protein
LKPIPQVGEHLPHGLFLLNGISTDDAFVDLVYGKVIDDAEFANELHIPYVADAVATWTLPSPETLAHVLCLSPAG